MDAGAIYFGCSPGLNCNVSLAFNVFTENKAENKGGAILWVNQNFTTAIM